MVYCAVFGCKNNNKKTKKPREVVYNFFKFPKDARIRAQWIQRCCRQDTFNADTARICSDHFRIDDYPVKYQLPDYSPKQKLLKPGVLPTLNLPTTNVGDGTGDLVSSSKKRIKKIFANDHSDETIAENTLADRDAQDEFDLEDRSERERQYKKIYILEAEIKKLKEEIEIQQRQLIEHQNGMKKIFSRTQLLAPGNANHSDWSKDELTNMLSLNAIEPSAYTTLLHENHPLPSFSTLKSWTPKARVQNNG